MLGSLVRVLYLYALLSGGSCSDGIRWRSCEVYGTYRSRRRGFALEQKAIASRDVQ